MTDTVEKYLEKQKAKEKPLRLVLTDHWFEEIKSGRKTHEYRKATPFWEKRICKMRLNGFLIEFQKAYRKNPELMTFEVDRVHIVNGLNTDLKCDCEVFDIVLGDRIK